MGGPKFTVVFVFPVLRHSSSIKFVRKTGSRRTFLGLRRLSSSVWGPTDVFTSETLDPPNRQGSFVLSSHPGKKTSFPPVLEPFRHRPLAPVRWETLPLSGTVLTFRWTLRRTVHLCTTHRPS